MTANIAKTAELSVNLNDVLGACLPAEDFVAKKVSMRVDEILEMREAIIAGEILVTVDLEHDPVADPDHDSMVYPFEMCEISNLELETEACILISFSNAYPVGFPHDHVLEVHVM